MKKWSVLILTALMITGCQSPAKPNAKSVAEVMEQLSRKADPEQTLVDVDADQIDAFYFFAPDEVLDQKMKMAKLEKACILNEGAVFAVVVGEQADAVCSAGLE